MPVWAQEIRTGSIAGHVVCPSTGEVLAGAAVSVLGTPLQATSDLNGAYRITGVEPGAYTLNATSEGFRSSNMTNVTVAADTTSRADIPLERLPDGSDLVDLGDFVITSEYADGSVLALLGDRQKSVTVSDAISSDDFNRLGAGDAAEAMSHVTGASVLDGKYVLIRGLGDRYSNTLLNNMSVPSADPDKRAVQMDQFPSEVLESIVTSKSFTPDQPGGFSGGSVNLRTKSFPDNFFVSTSVSVSYNTAATGDEALEVPGGGQDWLGRDDGTRALPRDIPAAIPSQTDGRLAARRGDFGPAEELDRVSNSLHNETYFPSGKKAGPDMGFSVATGDRLEFGKDRMIGYMFSLAYDRSTSHYTGGYAARYSQGNTDPESPGFVDGLLVYSPDLDDVSFKELYEANPDVPGGEPEFGVTRSSQDVNWGTYAQVAFKPSLNHEVTFRYLHNQSASDQVKRGVGESTRSDAGRLFNNYDLIYTERSMDSYQLTGQSLFPGLRDLRLDWRASTSQSVQDQPDYRTITYFWDFANQVFASAAGVGQNRVFREVVEDNDEIGLDFTLPIELRDRPGSIKFGGNWQDGGRTYRERRFRWSREANNIDVIENYPNPVGITDRTDTTVTFGNTITELSNRLLNYDGAQGVDAAYIMADIAPAERWRAIFGVRMEHTEMSTEAISEDANFDAADIDQRDWLPALSLVFAARHDMNIRAAYGRTVARPLYREVADVRVDDFFLDEYFTGNPDLKVSQIDNYDLRWEWFPGGTDVFAAGVYYKSFTDPIEVLIVADEGAKKPQNLDSGELYGVEFEARFGLERFSARLASFSVGGNFALIDSKAGIPPEELAITRQAFPDAPSTRELFGQSPYVVNLDVSYVSGDRATAVTLAANFVGERLALVTNNALPEIYEHPGATLDLVISRRLGRDWKLKLTARNLLDSDSVKSFEHAGREYYYERYQRGRDFTLGLSYFFE